jgi:hypothetical protein
MEKKDEISSLQLLEFLLFQGPLFLSFYFGQHQLLFTIIW